MATRLPGEPSDRLDLEALAGLDAELGSALSSPLALLSPNRSLDRRPLGRKGGGLGATTTGGVASAVVARVVPPDAAALGQGEEDELGELPSFRGARRGGAAARVDVRRQSLTLGSLFQATAAGAGLLDDSEISVGDDDILTSLSHARLLGGGTSHAALHVEPDTDDALLGGDLPEPQFSPALPSPEAPGPWQCADPVVARRGRRASSPSGERARRPCATVACNSPACPLLQACATAWPCLAA